MDNGNKINISKPEVKLFLHGDLLPDNLEAPKKYDLATEYAKTRSRRPSFIIVVLLLCVGAVTALTIGLASFLQERNNSLKVDIQVFEDLNLKSLLDVVSRTQASLDQVIQEKNLIQVEYSAKLEQVRLRRDSELQLLASLKLDQSEKDNETERIYEEYDSSSSMLYAEFQPQIELLEGQMDDYTKQLASFNTTNVEIAQEQEFILNSQRQAYELEKQELVASYEKLVEDLVTEIDSLQNMQLETQKTALSTLSVQHEKELDVLDPIFTDKNAIATVSRHQSEKATIDFLQGNYRIIVEDELLQSDIDAMLGGLNSEYAEFNYVADIVSSVPWQNSLREYIQALTNMANTVGQDIVRANAQIIKKQEEALQKSQEALLLTEADLADALLIQEQDGKQIAELEILVQDLQADLRSIQENIAVYQDIIIAVDERAKANGDAGYILSVSDRRNIPVYISPSFINTVQNGTRAYVYRDGGNLIGLVTINRKGNAFFATPDPETADEIRVNDVLLFELVQ